MVVLSPDGVGSYTNTKTAAGHFRSTSLKRLCVSSYTPKHPVIKEHIEYSEPPDVSTDNKNKIKMAFDYIRPSDSKSYNTFPSIRAEKGRVIRLSASKSDYPDSTLVGRFSQAMFTRNWYPFTRVPFVTLDPLRNLFVSWIYPKLLKDEEYNFSEIGDLVTYNPDTCPYVDSFMDAVPVQSPIMCVSDDELIIRLRKIIEDEDSKLLYVMYMAINLNCLGSLLEYNSDLDYIIESYSQTAILAAVNAMGVEYGFKYDPNMDYEDEIVEYINQFDPLFSVEDTENHDENPSDQEDVAPASTSLFDEKGVDIFTLLGDEGKDTKRTMDTGKKK